MVEAEMSDEELRKLLKPDPSELDIKRILEASYIQGEQTYRIHNPLDSYDDCNFKVEIDGKLYLLKIHNGVESNDFLQVYKQAGNDFDKTTDSIVHFQVAIIATLSQHKIPTSEGVNPVNSNMPLCIHTLPVLSKERGSQELVVRLMNWIHGRPMSDLPLLPIESLADAGRTLGRVDLALDHISPDSHIAQLYSCNNNNNNATETQFQAGRRYHQWDGKHTRDLQTFVHCIKDDKRRAMVESVIDAFGTELLDSGVASSFRKGVNHGDFNDANVMVDKDLKVCGVIDFGDSIESWRVLDVSVAMAYAMISTYGKCHRSIAAAAALLRGYNSVYPLTDTERKHLVLLMACRLSCSVTLGAFSYQQNPENEYLLLHAEPAWKALELIWGYDSERRTQVSAAVDQVFRQACLYKDSNDPVIPCTDLELPDPAIADILQGLRVGSIFSSQPSAKKRKTGTASNESRDMTNTITFVTGNSKKLEEVKRILHSSTSLPFTLTNQKIDLPELQGEALNVAREKCYAATEQIGGAVIVEDTSLCFNALGGMPGVFIKWFLDSCGHVGLNKMIASHDNKTAYAQTVVAFSAGPGCDPVLFDGRTVGKIVMPRGKLEFGWDPIFEPDEGNGKTYAEMSKEEKDAISHRSRAFVQFRNYLYKFQSQIQAQMAGAPIVPRSNRGTR